MGKEVLVHRIVSKEGSIGSACVQSECFDIRN